MKDSDHLFGNIFREFYNNGELGSRILTAAKDLEDFIPKSNLSGKTFLDAGCGGGIISAAATKFDPIKIVSFDYDPKMVEFSKKVKKQSAYLGDWSIISGNILDSSFVESLPQFDYVYCWGVVHHTGDMWKGIANIITRVADNGYIYLGIYNDASAFGFWDDRRFGTSLMWKKIKSALYKSPRLIKHAISKSAKAIYWIFSKTEFLFGKYKFKNFEQRGMDSDVSIDDWLFGHPYEYASVDEIINYMREEGFILEKIQSNIGLRTNHYLFKKVKI